MTTAQVLLVEDDSELRQIVRRVLERDGLAVTARATGEEALRVVDLGAPDVLVLDIGLPDSDGRDLCQAIRARGVSAPVLFLTAHDAVVDRLAGFSAGGDDYVVKPFDLDELVARVRALLRRPVVDVAITIGALRLDPFHHSARLGADTIALTPTEFRLLTRLAAACGEPVPRRALRESAWPHGGVVHDNTLDAHVARLRRKLRGCDGAPEIQTVHGVGYLIK
jgi:two-component system OmpR family response regulator